MKHFLLIFGLILASASHASANDMTNLNALPSKWQGEAGDLAVRVPATFQIDTSKLVDRNPGSIEKLYEVKGSLTFGTRSVPVYKISLRNQDESPASSTVEIIIYMNYELVPSISGGIVFDKKTSVYTLKDFIAPPLGRRLILHGS